MAFDKDIPLPGTSLRSSNPQILENQESMQEAVNNEHIFSGTDSGTQTGDHTQGSARCYFTGTEPATRIDGEDFLSTDLGSLWVDSADNAIYILTAITPTWTPVSTEVIDTLLATSRTFLGALDVTGTLAALAAMTVAGTFESTGVATLADASVTKTTAAPGADAQISNKKYVDDQITAAVPSGTSGASESNGETAIGDIELKWGDVTPSGNGFVRWDAASGAGEVGDMGLSSFSNQCFQVIVCHGDDSIGGEGIHVFNIDKDGFEVKYENPTPVTRVFAIGF
jgi:hypothetical protein